VDHLFGYTGREWDEDADLQYNRARWYDPATGRWLSQDPIGFNAGDGNLYRYVGNSPTTKIDPTGLYYWGWQESLGEFLAVNVLIPIVGVENLANASDTTLVTGTVIASVPIAVGIVAGGEVVLGVGTLGGVATTTATCTGALTTVTTGAGTVHVSTVGTVATVEVGHIESVTVSLVRTVAQTAASQGARTAIVNTGPVVNPDLAIKLGLAAQNGTKVLGGTVRLVEGGIAPIFEIIIPLL
jgi:RHS repeat-associated protein